MVRLTAADTLACKMKFYNDVKNLNIFKMK